MPVYSRVDCRLSEKSKIFERRFEEFEGTMCPLGHEEGG